MEEENLCECCGQKPKEDGFRYLCKNCFRKGGEVPDGHNKRNGHSKEGKS